MPQVVSTAMTSGSSASGQGTLLGSAWRVRWRRRSSMRAPLVCCGWVHKSTQGSDHGSQVGHGRVRPHQSLGDGCLGGACATEAAERPHQLVRRPFRRVPQVLARLPRLRGGDVPLEVVHALPGDRGELRPHLVEEVEPRVGHGAQPRACET